MIVSVTTNSRSLVKSYAYLQEICQCFPYRVLSHLFLFYSTLGFCWLGNLYVATVQDHHSQCYLQLGLVGKFKEIDLMVALITPSSDCTLNFHIKCILQRSVRSFQAFTTEATAASTAAAAVGIKGFQPEPQK